MKWFERGLGAVALLLLMAATSAAQMGQVQGEVLDMEGKPFADVNVVIASKEFGSKFEVKTDKKGQFIQAGLRPGLYTLTFFVKGQPVYEQEFMVKSGTDAPLLTVNFKEVLAKDAETRKKREEETAKFENMKTRFDTGTLALTEARNVSQQIPRTPAAERGALEQRRGELLQLAVTEFEGAVQAAPDKDPNLHKIYANLAQAYEMAGRYPDAVATYEKAIALKPEVGYFLGLGTTQARTGNAEAAGASCDKATVLDKAVAASCWRNIGIVFYNGGKMAEAVPPLRKASELDPAHAQTWYLLGASLINTMTSRMEGDKVIPVLQPGTVEAYQKCIELDANGVYGQQCKQGLEQIEAMGVGIQTKVRAKKR